MPDPITMAIATAVASQTAQSLTSQAGHAIAEITRRIQQKFHESPADSAILAAAQGSPEQATELAQALDRAFAEDPAFGRDIRALWDQSGDISITASGDAVVNVLHGKADKVVQLRDIHGDLTIN